MSLTVSVKALGQLGTNCIVIADPAQKTLIVFDAPIGVGGFLSEFQGYKVAALLLTHGHFDHILGVGDIHGCDIYASAADAKLFRRPQVMSAWMSPDDAASLRPVPVTHWIEGPQTLTLGGVKIEVRCSPGHSAGSVVYYLPELESAIVGDTIFLGGVGRTDLPSGSTEELEATLREQILTLPPKTILYPGHGPRTTVAEEAENNPYLRR